MPEIPRSLPPSSAPLLPHAAHKLRLTAHLPPARGRWRNSTFSCSARPPRSATPSRADSAWPRASSFCASLTTSLSTSPRSRCVAHCITRVQCPTHLAAQCIARGDQSSGPTPACTAVRRTTPTTPPSSTTTPSRALRRASTRRQSLPCLRCSREARLRSSQETTFSKCGWRAASS